MRTRFILIACLAIATQALGAEVYETSDSLQPQWQPSWSNQDSTLKIADSNEEQEKRRPVVFDDIAEQLPVLETSSYNANIQSGPNTVAGTIKQYLQPIIDNILSSSREGRILANQEYDEIYSDPEIKNAFLVGNDTIARTYIKDKLCSLGLMNCEDTEERRPPHRDIYPHDVIYAQPVTIRPVGRPLAAIPVKRPYGPAKPVPLPPSFGSSIYPPPLPSLGGGKPLPSFIGPYPGYKKPSFPPPFLSKPIYESGIDIGSDFEDKFIDKKQVVVHQPVPSGVQQHVHHHYHHGEDDAASGVAHNPGVISSSPQIGGLGHYGYGNGGTYGSTFNDFEDYKKEFKIKTPTSNSSPSSSSFTKGYAERYPSYQKPNGKQFVSNGQFDADSNYGFSSHEDCICVPYEQCATINQVGRKDDLYLPIDPRTLDKGIEAEIEEVITDGNGTMTVVRVTKGVNGTEQIKETKNELTGEAEVTKRSRRDVKQVTEKVQERLTVGTGDLDTSKLNVRPTWGVSFGLPQTGGVGPIAPHSGNPLGIPGYTPGYGLVGGQGINLGPVSVNPLLAVQVTKDEYGEKVVKPYVNLHVTPNPGLVHKLGSLLAYKKYGLYGGHYGGHYNGYDVYAPHYHTHHERPIYHYPSRPPFYPSHGDHHLEHYPSHKPHYHGGYYPSYPKDYNDDNYNDYDYSDDYADDYYRNARGKDAPKAKDKQFPTKGLPRGSTGGDERRAKGKITFSDRRKRDTTTFNDITLERRRNGRPQSCGPYHVCCQRSHIIGARPQPGQCGRRNAQGIHGRIKTPEYVDGDADFGEYPWQVVILQKNPSESVYICGGTLISPRHILTAAHCVKAYASHNLRVRLGEWDVNQDIEFYPYIERDIVSVNIHPDFYAGTLYNDIAILKLDHDIDFAKNPHISPACLPNKYDNFSGTKCWTTGWGKNSFDNGKYQNILKEVDVPVISNHLCEQQMRRTKLGPSFQLHQGFVCAGGEEGKDACKGDGGGPLVCERNDQWQLVGIVSWGIECGHANVPGVYARVSYYLDWIRQVIDNGF